MNIKDNRSDISSELRKQTEKKLQQKMIRTMENLTTLPPEKILQLFHDLEVYQIELEMQNDELLRSQEELHDSQKRYSDLFDLAPVGCCVVSENGLILKVNLIAATLLGKTRNELISQPITQFIFREDQDIYYLHRKMLFETRQPQTFELRMVQISRPLFWVRLDTIIAGNRGETPACLVALTDISESKRTEHTLKERIKELNFFFNLSDLLEKTDNGLDEILKKTVILIPLAWQFPEIAEACIELEGQTFQTAHFRKTQWMQTSNIIIQEKMVGKITVCYLEAPQTVTEEMFLLEERRLLNAIAQKIGYIIDRVRMTETVKQGEIFLRTAINAITNPFAVINAIDYTVEMANAAYGGGNATGLKCHAVSHQRDTPCTGDDYPCSVLEVKRTEKPFIGEHVHCDE
ncbi:MAG: PAS domain-containing protein, partial [Proteobacteria bacterium]|nr:PAS domain-containing protein [Pseudomonadota bacterium]